MPRKNSQPEWRTMREKGKKRPPSDHDSLPRSRWWTLSDEVLPGAILGTVEHIRQQQSALRQQRAICARLYGGLAPASAYGATSASRLQLIHPSASGRLVYNLSAIVTDSLVSKV